MPRQMRVGGVGEIPPGKAKVVVVSKSEEYAVYNVDGALYATGNVCPHSGGPLGEGELEGPVVTCPWHAWQFDVRTGIALDFPEDHVLTYPVKVQGDEIYIELPD